MKKFILGLIAFIAFTPLLGQSKKSIKNDIQASIERQKEKLIDISYAIWEAAETSLEEFTSSKLLMDYARENGFEVTENVADISTAFMASYGSGKPVIGILGEFDANAGISQKLQPVKEARIEGAAGHGCGHNLYGTASLAAAIAIKEQIEKGTLKGTVIFYGTPAEETIFAKVWMVREGVFDQLDVCMDWHPGDTFSISALHLSIKVPYFSNSGHKNEKVTSYLAMSSTSLGVSSLRSSSSSAS